MVKMPQRQRHNTGGGTGGADLPLLDPCGVIEAHNSVSAIRCCVPLTSGCIKGYEPIIPEASAGCVRVICNNEHCTAGSLMHQECFQAWEQYISFYLKSCGRARSWSEKQRLQNIWTKKGYNLAYRACSCNCGKGHLRKDFNWITKEESDKENNMRKRKEKNICNKPTVIMNSPPKEKYIERTRNNSSSSNGSTPNFDSPQSPKPQPKPSKKKERNRHGSGGIFARRNDFSVFNALPKNKINSYHIKMEGDGYHGNDETRNFVLSTLTSHNICKTTCVICYQSLLVFHKYPLIDGTFFLTPVQHSKSSVPVDVDGRTQYLSSICIGCLEGWNIIIKCCYCHSPWDGSSLILGTMYSFDIFAAMPCCRERLQCTRCHGPVISADQKLPFFSEYSRSLSCPHCGYLDYHFLKPISTSFYRRERQFSNW